MGWTDFISAKFFNQLYVCITSLMTEFCWLIHHPFDLSCEDLSSGRRSIFSCERCKITGTFFGRIRTKIFDHVIRIVFFCCMLSGDEEHISLRRRVEVFLFRSLSFANKISVGLSVELISALCSLMTCACIAHDSQKQHTAGGCNNYPSWRQNPVLSVIF